MHYTVRGGSDFTVNDAQHRLRLRHLRLRASHRRRAGAVHPAVDRPARAVLVLAGGGGDRVRERQRRLKHQFATPGHELGVNLQFTRGREDEAYFLNEESPVRVGTDTTHIVAVENTLPLSIDYTRPLPTGRLELGTKLQRRWIPVTYTVRARRRRA